MAAQPDPKATPAPPSSTIRLGPGASTNANGPCPKNESLR